jgi:UDP-N-acetylmuramoylalanine-D-glutamate ligase
MTTSHLPPHYPPPPLDAPSIHVLILGTSIGGLALAQGLRKHGVSFEIIDVKREADSSQDRSDHEDVVETDLSKFPMMLTSPTAIPRK